MICHNTCSWIASKWLGASVLLVYCALFVASAPALADDAPSGDWVLGTWSVTYSDLLFADGFGVNEITGTAFVHRAHDSAGAGGASTAYYAVVQFQDPVDGTVHRLSSASVEVRGKTATLVLLGTCPTRSRTSDGEHDVREWFPDDTEEGEGEAGAPHGDPTFVPIPAGHTLTFRPAEKNPGPAAEVVAPPRNNPARERYTVTLERSHSEDTSMLTGTWQYAHGPSGMYGRRVGQVDEAFETVSGIETWTRAQSNAILSVTEDHAARVMIEGGVGREPAVQTRLTIRGWDLPTTAGQLGGSVSFGDPLIHFGRFVSASAAGPQTDDAPRTPGELVVEVILAAGVVPGSKGIRVGEASASWELEIPGREPRVRFVVDTDAQRAIPALFLIQGQPFFVECRFDEGLDFSHRLAQIDLGNGLAPVSLLMTRVPGEEQVYRSPRLRAVKPGTSVQHAADDQAVPLPIAAGRVLLIDSADTQEPQHWGGITVYEEGAMDRPMLVVFPAGLERWHSDHSIHRVSKEQPFALRLRVPNDGSHREEEHTVRFELVEGDAGFDVTCKRLPTGDSEPFAYYAPTAPLTVAQGQADWTLGGTLPLALPGIEDGAELRVRFGEGDEAVTHTLTVHDTELNRQIAVMRRQLEIVRDGGLALLEDPRLDVQDRGEIGFRITLVSHAMALIERDDLWGIHKAAVLVAYLTMVQEPFAWHTERPTVAHDPRYGLDLLSAREHVMLYHAIDVLARDRINEITTRLVRDIGVGAADMVMGSFAAVDIFTAITGVDVHGRPVSFLARVFSGLKAVLDIGMNYRKMSGRGPFGERIQRANGDTTVRPRPMTPIEATRQLDLEMRRAGFPPARAAREAQSMLHSGDNLSPEAAALGRAIDDGASPDEMMRRFGRSREQVAGMLDDYYRHGVGIDDPRVRQRMLRRVMGEDAVPAATDSRVGRASRTDLDAPRPASDPDGGVRTNEESWPPMNDAEVSGSRTRVSGHAAADSGSGSLSDSDFGDMEWDIYIAQGQARQPHRGPGRMAAYHDARIKMHEALLRERGLSAEQIAASTATLRSQYAQHMQTAELIEKVRTWREYRDLQAAAVFYVKGFTPRQSAVGHFYLSEMAVDGASAPVLRQIRATHADIPAALGIDRATWRSELGTFLQRNYTGITRPQVNAALDDYFRFVDGGAP